MSRKTDPSTRPLTRLWNDERAVSSQIDFAVSMVIRLGAFSLFLLLGTAFLISLFSGSPTGQATAERAGAMLTEDHLTNPVGNDTLDRDCTEAFFAQNTSACGFDSDWTSSDEDYLNAALYVQTWNINVSITDTDGNVAAINGTTLRAGDNRANADEQRLDQWTRHVALDGDGDGSYEYYSVTVGVWR